MACLNVESVNEKIACIQNLEEQALEQETQKIIRDLKGYILANFSVDEFQKRLIDRTSDDAYREYGEAIANAFRNRYDIEAEPAKTKKCPKIKITFTIEIG